MAISYEQIKKMEALREIIDRCRCTANNQEDFDHEVSYEKNKSTVSVHG
jgi:hypothetical protein